MSTVYRNVSFALVFLSVLTFNQATRAQSLYINEFMASNASALQDPDYKAYSDWIEIFNSGKTPYNLRGCYVTDDLKNLKKYRIPSDAIIPEGGFLILWADEMNTGIHLNFKLSASGESLGISDSTGTLLDSLSFGPQLTDISLGRFPDGSSEIMKFFPSSPMSTNIEKNIYAKLPVPSFSLPGGFYDNPVTLTLTDSLPGALIRYTTDGSMPNEKSTLYSGSLRLDTTVVLSARAFKDGFIPSTSVVKTFFVQFKTDLPVFSLSTDPANFFSDTIGIYVVGTRGISGYCVTEPRNWNQDWERPVNLEFYEKDKSPAFSVRSGIKIFGGCTRKYPMKSLALYFRDSYGDSKLNYRLFRDLPVTVFDNFVLRISGQDWYRTMFRDGMIHTLVKQGMNVDYQEYRPSVLFINGQYWGIHNIREKVNEDYISYRYGVDPDSVDLIQYGTKGVALNGNLTAYNSFYSFFSAHNLAAEENYNYIKSVLDIDEFIDYQIAEIYVANGDWPGGNTKLWRERTPTAKWRWLLYDVDCTFGGNALGLYNTNSLERATASSVSLAWATLPLKKLLENTEFRNEFIQRFAVHMGTTFEKNHVISVIDSMAGNISSEIPRHIKRWPESISFDAKTFTGNVQILKDFATKRQTEVRNHFYAKFNLPGSYGLTITRNNPAWGKIIAHTIEIKNNWTKLPLFKNVPFRAKALPIPGYRFVRWEGASTATSPEIVLIDSVSSTLTAIFEPDEPTTSGVVINEINYRSSPSFDTDDWIELYNPSDKDVDISMWKLLDKSASEAFTFPQAASIPAMGYLVVCKDTLRFNPLYFNKVRSIGNFSFGLDSDGDLIRLLDTRGVVVDSVLYSSAGQWPSLLTGAWPTLSLINPKLDNSLAKSWKASLSHGTPGKLNDTYSTGVVKNNTAEYPQEFHLFDNYPNPFNSSTVISFSIPERMHVSLRVYDLLGREVARLFEGETNAGNYNMPFSMNSGSGIYIYVLQAGKYLQSKKMLLLK